MEFERTDTASFLQWPKNLKQEPVFLNAQMGDKYDMVASRRLTPPTNFTSSTLASSLRR